MAPRLTASRTVLPPASHPRLCLAPCAEMPPLTWLRTNRDQMLGADACVRKYRETRVQGGAWLWCDPPPPPSLSLGARREEH